MICHYYVCSDLHIYLVWKPVFVQTNKMLQILPSKILNPENNVVKTVINRPDFSCLLYYEPWCCCTAGTTGCTCRCSTCVQWYPVADVLPCDLHLSTAAAAAARCIVPRTQQFQWCPIARKITQSDSKNMDSSPTQVCCWMHSTISLALSNLRQKWQQKFKILVRHLNNQNTQKPHKYIKAQS